MNKLTLDFEFDKNLQKKKPTIDDEKDVVQSWADIRDFILNRSNVEVLHDENLNNIDFNTTHPFIYKLYNDHLQNIKRVSIKKSTDIDCEFYKHSNDHYFFIDKTTLGFKPSDFGLLNFDSKNLLNRWKNKENYTLSYRNEAMEFSFEAIKQYSHPTQEIIIIDRYILNNKEKLIFNLINFLKAIIIQSKALKLYIFSSSSDLHKSFNNERNNIQSVLLDELNQFFNDIEIEIFLDYRSQIIQDNVTNKQFEVFHREHARYIFTNYMMIKSGQGFHIYNKLDVKNRSYNDEITFSPLCHLGNQKIASNVFASLKKIISHQDNVKNNPEIFGQINLLK